MVSSLLMYDNCLKQYLACGRELLVADTRGPSADWRRLETGSCARPVGRLGAEATISAKLLSKTATIYLLIDLWQGTTFATMIVCIKASRLQFTAYMLTCLHAYMLFTSLRKESDANLCSALHQASLRLAKALRQYRLARKGENPALPVSRKSRTLGCVVSVSRC